MRNASSFTYAPGQQTKFHGDIAIPPIPIDQQSLVALNYLSLITYPHPAKNPDPRPLALIFLDTQRPFVTC